MPGCWIAASVRASRSKRRRRSSVSSSARQHLQRDVAAELGILGLVDVSHAAAAEQPEDAVGPDGGAGRQLGRLAGRSPIAGAVVPQLGREGSRAELAVVRFGELEQAQRFPAERSSRPQAACRKERRSAAGPLERLVQELVEPRPALAFDHPLLRGRDADGRPTARGGGKRSTQASGGPGSRTRGAGGNSGPKSVLTGRPARTPRQDRPGGPMQSRSKPGPTPVPR